MSEISPREYWFALAQRIADPVLTAASEQRLRAAIPPVIGSGGEDRPNFAPQEALCRTLSGLAPWLADRCAAG